jgi:predicted nucleic-acid-binding Zn-ribbon protein
MAICPKCGKVLEKESDYVIERNIKLELPGFFDIGSKAFPVSCRYCGTILGFVSFG